MEVEVRPAVGPVGSCAAQGPRALCSAAATVPVFQQDTGAPMPGQQRWEAVHGRRSEGRSISAIARDLEPYIGQSGRVSEVLNRKRALNLRIVKRLHDGLRIPYERLLAGVR